jgi:hypothetical protein
MGLGLTGSALGRAGEPCPVDVLGTEDAGTVGVTETAESEGTGSPDGTGEVAGAAKQPPRTRASTINAK